MGAPDISAQPTGGGEILFLDEAVEKDVARRALEILDKTHPGWKGLYCDDILIRIMYPGGQATLHEVVAYLPEHDEDRSLSMDVTPVAFPNPDPASASEPSP